MNTLAIIWDPPLGLDLGFFLVRYYSLMFVIGFALGYRIVKQMFKVEGIDEKHLDKLLMFIVIPTILGARLGHVFFYDWAYFKNHLAEILLPVKFEPTFRFTGFSGLASHGGSIIILSLWYYAKYELKKPLLYLLDRIGITVALVGSFIRIGNLMNSEIIGYPTGSNYGFVFKALGENFARHPTQLYESACYFAIFALLFYLFWKTNVKQKQGFLFGLFFTLLWSARFVVEFFKEAQIDNRASWTLNTGQWLSIPLVLVGLYLMIKAKPVTEKA